MQTWQKVCWPSQSRRIIFLPISMSPMHITHWSSTWDSSAVNWLNFLRSQNVVPHLFHHLRKEIQSVLKAHLHRTSRCSHSIFGSFNLLSSFINSFSSCFSLFERLLFSKATSKHSRWLWFFCSKIVYLKRTENIFKDFIFTINLFL